jgi:hypothetical protein
MDKRHCHYWAGAKASRKKVRLAFSPSNVGFSCAGLVFETLRRNIVAFRFLAPLKAYIGSADAGPLITIDFKKNIDPFPPSDFSIDLRSLPKAGTGFSITIKEQSIVLK